MIRSTVLLLISVRKSSEVSLTSRIEIIKEVYAAINRNDIPGVLQLFDPQIVRVEFEGSPSSGVYRGLEEMKVHFSKARATWAEGSCGPERFLVSNDKVVVFVHVHVRLKDQLRWIDSRIADVFTFRNDKIIEMRSFIESKQALEWAGLKAE